MTEQTYSPVEPHWPLGRVAQFYVKHPAGGLDIGVRELIVSSVTPTDNGWLVKAELPGHIFDTKHREFVFEVDEDGESSECVPWDQTLEQATHPMHGFQAGAVEVDLACEPQGIVWSNWGKTADVIPNDVERFAEAQTIDDDDRNGKHDSDFEEDWTTVLDSTSKGGQS